MARSYWEMGTSWSLLRCAVRIVMTGDLECLRNEGGDFNLTVIVNRRLGGVAVSW